MTGDEGDHLLEPGARRELRRAALLERRRIAHSGHARLVIVGPTPRSGRVDRPEAGLAPVLPASEPEDT